MYFGSVGGGIDWFFSKSTWTIIVIAFILAAWKIIDIFIWIFSHISISWS